MKVLQLSTSLSGGAGIAARRAHVAFRTQGIESDLVTFLNSADDTDSVHFMQGIQRSSIEKLQSKALTFLQHSIIQKGPYLQTPISLGIDPAKLMVENYDIVHIHAMYNLVNSRTLRQILEFGIPTFITMHDQRFATGGCHGSMNCTNYRKNCRRCPQVRSVFRPIVQTAFSEVKYLLATTFNPPTVITPSLWLGSIAQEVFPETVVKNLNNCVDDVFFEKMREKFYNPLAKKISLGFSSLDLNNPYKGLNELMSAIAMLELPLREKIHMVLIGDGKASTIPDGVKVIYTGKIYGGELARVMSELDVLVVPSLQDNLPNVMCEALALGVPVIGAETGGIPEVLKKFNLPTFSARKHEELASILSRGMNLRSLKVNVAVAKDLFSGESYTRKILEIYRESQGRIVA